MSIATDQIVVMDTNGMVKRNNLDWLGLAEDMEA